MAMKNLFNTREEAEKYRVEHELWVTAPEYIRFRNKWVLVFPLKGCITVEQ